MMRVGPLGRTVPQDKVDRLEGRHEQVRRHAITREQHESNLLSGYFDSLAHFQTVDLFEPYTHEISRGPVFFPKGRAETWKNGVDIYKKQR